MGPWLWWYNVFKLRDVLGKRSAVEPLIIIVSRRNVVCGSQHSFFLFLNSRQEGGDGLQSLGYNSELFAALVCFNLQSLADGQEFDLRHRDYTVGYDLVPIDAVAARTYLEMRVVL